MDDRTAADELLSRLQRFRAPKHYLYRNGRYLRLLWGGNEGRNIVLWIHGDEVSGNYFDLLGVQPQAGRFFHASDEHGPGSAPYLVLSDALWRNAFQADRTILGSIIELNKHPFTVVGVAPANFHGVERFTWPEYWLPMLNEEQVEGSEYLHSRTDITTTIIGRLRPGVTPQQATQNLNAISAQLEKEYPKTDDGQPLRLIHPGLFGDDGEVIRGFLYSVTVLALLVLTAACANLATLVAARAADRNRELALRVALGSSRRRLLSHLLTEAVLLSLIGGAAGLLSANLLLGVLNQWDRAAQAHLDATVDTRVYFAGLAFTFGSALLFGMVPALQALKSSPLQMMKSGPVDSLHLRRFALRDLLLGTQIAICTVLVTASLVAVRGMEEAMHAPLGLKPQGAMLADLDLHQIAPNAGLVLQKQKEILDAARGIPGVTAAGTVNRTPMTGGIHGIPVYRPGTTEFTMQSYALTPYVFSMSPGYLQAAGTRLLGGRDVSWQDTTRTPYVAIVNQTFARKMWGFTHPIGQRFILWGNLTEVVGIAEDGKYHDLQEPPQSAVYLPLSQSEQSASVFVVRSYRPPNEMTAALEQTLHRIAPNVALQLQSWSDTLQSELFPARAATVALGAIGLLAAMLSVTGISGMAAYSVSRRKKELGIRVALGARKTQVLSAAVGRPILVLGIGSLLGLLAGIFTSRLLGHVVYHANPGDPIVLVATILTMALLGIAASAIPARRALFVDSSILMREE